MLCYSFWNISSSSLKILAKTIAIIVVSVPGEMVGRTENSLCERERERVRNALVQNQLGEIRSTKSNIFVRVPN